MAGLDPGLSISCHCEACAARRSNLAPTTPGLLRFARNDEEEAAMILVEAKGAKIPAVGLGTWDLRGRTCARVVEQALRLGYRHFDTAEMYDNEREVGEGLRASGVK